MVIDDGNYLANNFALTVSNEELSVTKLKCGIALGIESFQRVLQKIGHGIRAVLIEIIVKAYKILQFALGGYTFNTDSGHIEYTF
jgi:hypothetical protein